MNKDRAHDLAASLRHKMVGTWIVSDLIDFGKSAAVFRASREGQEAAVKIFDRELVERYGKITQLNRIKREISLSTHKHLHLVEIHEGGECDATGHLYIAMEYVDAPSLDLMLDSIPRDSIRKIICEIAQAAQFLETLGIAHRDIKPANIAVSPHRTVLLDLGVVRAIANPGDTDDDDIKRFIGTLQYSPPEFLLRNEEDSMEGWRAVTFYQLGAVLYDLIESRQIFSDSLDPYARLVNAVQHETPLFSATDAPPDLMSLAERCLLKDPEARLKLVSWSDFENKPTETAPRISARERLKERLGSAKRPVVRQDADYHFRRALNGITVEVRDTIRGACVAEDALPPLRVHDLLMRSSNATFTITFSPSPRFGLHAYLTVEFVVELVDLGAKAITIGAIAWLNSSVPDAVEDDPVHEDIYCGLMHAGAIGEAALDFVLPVYERALTQQTTIEKHGGQMPISTTAEEYDE